MKHNQLPLAERLASRGHPPLVIAEMSGNHRGDLGNALAIVRAAAQAGADAIKLQTYTPATLTIDSYRSEFLIDDPASPWHGRRLWELYEEAHTPWDWHRRLFDEARAHGLYCISTAFDETSLKFLATERVDAVKIASFEVVHIPLLDEARKLGLPLLLSTGMASVDELDLAVKTIGAVPAGALVLLKCTSAYPASENDANLATMQDMRARYGCLVGLSDHTLQPMVAYCATALGACVVEKHFTLSRKDGGPDAAFSIEPDELRDLVRGVDLVWHSVGKIGYGALASEQTSLKERPSLYVVEDIRKGDVFTPQNLRVIRPGNGLAPHHLNAILGCVSAEDIAASTPMSLKFLTDEKVE